MKPDVQLDIERDERRLHILLSESLLHMEGKPMSVRTMGSDRLKQELQRELHDFRRRADANVDNAQTAARYRAFRTIVYAMKDESFDAYDAEGMDAELDRRIAEDPLLATDRHPALLSYQAAAPKKA